MDKLPIVFFGSGPVAAKSLELLADEFTIEAVVTKPKPAHHRGSFPVIDIAEARDLPLHTVSNKAELSALIATKPFSTEVAVLIDFGIIVGQDTIDYFPKGIVNSHFSVLPDLRGADPITFAILSGQKQTGVSLMLLVEAMDEGPLISFGTYDLPADITTPLLTEHLINFSHALLKAELPRYVYEDAVPAPQSVTGFEVSYSRKLSKQDGQIDWTKPAEQIEREIRAYAEWPKSYVNLAGIDVIITSAEVSDIQGNSGEHKTDSNQLLICCGTGSLLIKTLKPAGKKEMTAQEFLRGYGSKL